MNVSVTPAEVAAKEASAKETDARLAASRAMRAEGLLEHVEALKAAANKRVALVGASEAACAEYGVGVEMLTTAEADGRLAHEEERGMSHALQLALRLNAAACAIKLANFEQALSQSDAALGLSPASVKALFRRGQALQGLGRLAEAEAAFGGVIEREPASKEAHARRTQVREQLAGAA